MLYMYILYPILHMYVTDTPYPYKALIPYFAVILKLRTKKS